MRGPARPPGDHLDALRQPRPACGRAVGNEEEGRAQARRTATGSQHPIHGLGGTRRSRPGPAGRAARGGFGHSFFFFFGRGLTAYARRVFFGREGVRVVRGAPLDLK